MSGDGVGGSTGSRWTSSTEVGARVETYEDAGIGARRHTVVEKRV